ESSEPEYNGQRRLARPQKEEGTEAVREWNRALIGLETRDRIHDAGFFGEVSDRSQARSCPRKSQGSARPRLAGFQSARARRARAHDPRECNCPAHRA